MDAFLEGLGKVDTWKGDPDGESSRFWRQKRFGKGEKRKSSLSSSVRNAATENRGRVEGVFYFLLIDGGKNYRKTLIFALLLFLPSRSVNYRQTMVNRGGKTSLKVGKACQLDPHFLP